MHRHPRLAAGCALALWAASASAGEAHPPEPRLRLEVDALLRQEWSAGFFGAQSQDRWRARLLPRLSLASGALTLGLGADLEWSGEDNTQPGLTDAGYGGPPPMRDNYRSRDARLDLAFARLEPVSWLALEAGRFEMPVLLTEMTWDRDLRPQGAALTLGAMAGPFERVSLTVLGARGSHVFTDERTSLLLLSAAAGLMLGPQSRLQLAASWLSFPEAGRVEPRLRRQNTRLTGDSERPYHVVDVVARFRHDGGVPVQLVADYCWNIALRDGNHGFWLAAVAGSTGTARVRGEYTYARVDRDATLAAYAADDFLWATGWEGHRGDLGLRLAKGLALHAVGQLQRFKDSPAKEERGLWVRRLRLELRWRR